MLSSVWLISLRDLQWRRRRFIIAVVSAALAFALTLLLEGTVAHMRSEGPRVVNMFGADGWVVADGASGPFTTAQLLPAAATGAIAAIPGVTAASPLLVGRATVNDVDVNLVGYERGGVTEPPRVRSGRLPDRLGEALVDSSLGLRPGENVTILGRSFPIVGTTSGTTFYFGQATVFLPIEDVQQTLLAGQPLASAIVVRGRPGALPAGLTLMTDAQVTKDLARPLGQSAQTLTMINGLLWLTAAGVIGSIIYMTALERQRDVAVLKATGASTRSLLGGLAFEALVLAGTAAVIAGVLALLLEPLFPFPVEIPVKAYVKLVVVAVVVGLIASAAGGRRISRVDPALAFGGG
jgi:putative ABC transport system permease protein